MKFSDLSSSARSMLAALCAKAAAISQGKAYIVIALAAEVLLLYCGSCARRVWCIAIRSLSIRAMHCGV